MGSRVFNLKESPAQLERSQSARYRVLVVTNMWPYRGDPSYGSFVQDQMESLRPLGVEYDVFFINGREGRLNYFRAIPQLRRRLTGQAYDLIHAHFGLSGCVACTQRRVPVVLSFHGDDVLGKFRRNGRVTPYGRLLRLSSRVLSHFVAANIVQSEEMKARLRSQSAEIIPCGVDLNLFRPMDRIAARRALALDPQKKLVLFPYNPAEVRKRYDLVEGAVMLARKRVPELEILQVYGKPHGQMPLYMNAADVLVLPSLAEGSPVAVKEAMAVNLPVIAVKVGDTAELIGSAEGCHLVPRHADAISAKIVEVCETETRSKARDRIARLSMENVAGRIIQVYGSVVQPRAASPASRIGRVSG